MSGSKQRTLAGSVTREGTGLHSGDATSVTFSPGEPGSGLRFRRTDLEGSPSVPADLDHVTDTHLGTTIGSGDVSVRTVEHLLAALSALRIDNVTVDVHGPEAPILDGSFAAYVEALDEAGTVEQDAEAPSLEVSEPLTVHHTGGAEYVATPSAEMRISATIDFEDPSIGRQYGSFMTDEATFRAEIAPARTFGFESDAEALHARGLALGASLENTVVIGDRGVLNDALRFEDEFLRHKVGDLVGDLALLGARLKAHIVAERPSHAGNIQLARALRAHARQNTRKPLMDITQIMQFLPHRYPMLLVDRILEVVEGERIVAIKNVTINEPFFQGHYPGRPIMPGVLIVEAMAQAGGLLLMDKIENPQDKVVLFMTIDGVKFRRPVIPGDTLRFELEVVQFRRDVCKMKGKGLVEGAVVAEAEFMAKVADK